MVKIMCQGFKRTMLQSKPTDSVKMARYSTFYLGFSRLIRNPVASKPELGGSLGFCLF